MHKASLSIYLSIYLSVEGVGSIGQSVHLPCVHSEQEVKGWMRNQKKVREKKKMKTRCGAYSNFFSIYFSSLSFIVVVDIIIVRETSPLLVL